MVADEGEFDGDREEEEDGSDNCNRESGSLQATGGLQAWEVGESTIPLLNTVVGIDVSRSERSVDVSFAARSSPSCRICNIDEGSAESKIEEHSNEAQECNASETAY